MYIFLLCHYFAMLNIFEYLYVSWSYKYIMLEHVFDLFRAKSNHVSYLMQNIVTFHYHSIEYHRLLIANHDILSHLNKRMINQIYERPFDNIYTVF